MPQNDKRIQIGDLAHDIDAGQAKGAFRSGPGKLVVEMIPPPERLGGLLMPETVGANLRSDVGVVLSEPFETFDQGRTILSPAPGTLVCTLPYQGLWMERPDLGRYRTRNQVRVFGHYCEAQGQPEDYPWWQAIPCGIDPRDMTLTSFGDNVVFRPDEGEDVTSGGILLHHLSRPTQMAGTVISAGPLSGVEAGERFLFDPRAVEEERYGFDLCEETKDLYVMPARGILVVVGEAAAA